MSSSNLTVKSKTKKFKIFKNFFLLKIVKIIIFICLRVYRYNNNNNNNDDDDD